VAANSARASRAIHSGASNQADLQTLPPTVAALASGRQRRPAIAALGALLIAAAGLVGAIVFASLSSSQVYMAAARDIGPGEVVEAADFRALEVAGLGAANGITIAAQNEIIGSASRGSIPAGTVLNHAMFVTAGSAVPEGMVVTGAALEPGAAAGGTLRIGDTVEVLAAAQPAAALEVTALPEAQILAQGTVWSVSETISGSAGRIVLSILVPADALPSVAQAAADDRLRLALISG